MRKTNRTILAIAALCILIGSAGASQAQVCGDCNHDGSLDVLDSLQAALDQGATIGPRILECDVDESTGVDNVDSNLIPFPGLDCFTCGDCTGDEATDGADLAVLAGNLFTATGPRSDLAACDTNGDGFLNERDLYDYSAPGPFSCTTCGDCNQDGQVTIVDALKAARVAAGLDTFPTTGRAFDACNVDGAATPGITVVDALQIAQYVSGLAPLNCTLSTGGAVPASPAPQLQLVGGAYCIADSSDGTSWDATISFGALNFPIGPTSLPAGSSSSALALQWVNLFNAAAAGAGITAQTLMGNCMLFTIQGLPALPTITITSTTPNCTLSPASAPFASCPFNPDMVYDPLTDDRDKDGATSAQELFGGLGTDPENPDSDGDRAVDGKDNCPTVFNPDQANSDGDSLGDACEHLNGPPMIVEDYAATDGVPIKIDVLANDFDRDRNLDPGSLQVIGEPEHGSVSLQETHFLYKPNPDHQGIDHFKYQACDSNELCGIATVSLTVLSLDDD